MKGKTLMYPAVFAPASSGFVVTFRDIPEAITQGDSDLDAMEMAQDALITAMDFYFEDHRLVPMPSAPQPGDRLIELPPDVTASVLLLNDEITKEK